ncbi:MAG: YdeI/OmpD-associated family protein [Spirosomataceae bacterium]
MHYFSAPLDIIGVNPFVFVPADILEALFVQAGKRKGPIPVCGTLNGQAYTQTLVKYSGEWRLYINTVMLPNSPKRIGETLELSIQLDLSDRSIPIPPQLAKALSQNPEAQATFEKLSPSRQKEIVRYIASLKNEQSIAQNIEKAIGFLTGQNRFVGRGMP